MDFCQAFPTTFFEFFLFLKEIYYSLIFNKAKQLKFSFFALKNLSLRPITRQMEKLLPSRKSKKEIGLRLDTNGVWRTIHTPRKKQGCTQMKSPFSSLLFIAVLFCISLPSFAVSLADYPPAKQAEAFKNCTKILKKAKNTKSADSAATQIEKLLKTFEGKSTPMGEQGAPDADPKEEKRMNDKKKKKIAQDYQKEVSRLEKAEYFRSEKLRSAIESLPDPADITESPTKENSDSSL